MIRKWTEGKNQISSYDTIFANCRRVIGKLRSSSNWSDEQAAAFEQATLDNVSVISDMVRGQKTEQINKLFKLLIILDSLQDSERKTELLDSIRGKIETLDADLEGKNAAQIQKLENLI